MGVSFPNSLFFPVHFILKYVIEGNAKFWIDLSSCHCLQSKNKKGRNEETRRREGKEGRVRRKERNEIGGKTFCIFAEANNRKCIRD